MQKIVPSLWYDTQAEEAVKFYLTLFPDAKIISEARYDKAGAEVSGRPEGSLMTVEFELAGQRFIALNGGPIFTFTEAVSFMVNCDTQEEIDRLWNALTADGGQESQCGWLKDRWGLSWQITPTVLGKLMSDPTKAPKVMPAMLQMKKLDIAALEAAANT